MAKATLTPYFKEDWSDFKSGRLHRDNTARGEYMAMKVPANPNGWYHTCGAKPTPGSNFKSDRDHSSFTIKTSKGKRVIEMPHRCHSEGEIILTTGPQQLRDFELHCEIMVKDYFPAGLAVRYQTNRDFYGIVAESGMLKLVRVLEGCTTILDSAPWKGGKKTYKWMLRCTGELITARVGSTVLSARDGCLSDGGFGLWANGPARFGTMKVMASQAEISRVKRDAVRAASIISKKRKAYPGMELLAEVNVKGHALGRQIRLADVDGDGRAEIFFAMPTYHQGKKWKYDRICRQSALTLDGDVLWEWGKQQSDSGDVTTDLPFQVADRGKGHEMLACRGWDLHVLDPLTGKSKKKARLPKTPKMDPYWDEISMYFGAGHFDDIPYLIPDGLILCNFRGKHAHRDFFVKDRYHNVWGMNGDTLKPLWHHACNTGHTPYPCDWNGDGKDEVVLGYSRVDSKGNLVGRLFLGDHPDGCFHYVDENGHHHNLHPAGEAGLIDELDDYRVIITHLGHVQHLSVANFLPENPGLERVVVNYHFNENIVTLLDASNRVLRKTDAYGSGAICQPVNWLGDGTELLAFSPRHGDGGLWDANFDLVVPFPDDNRPGCYLEVYDALGLGVDQIIVWDENCLHVYGPKLAPKKRKKRYDPQRPHPNFSNYMVNFSLPRWV